MASPPGIKPINAADPSLNSLFIRIPRNLLRIATTKVSNEMPNNVFSLLNKYGHNHKVGGGVERIRTHFPPVPVHNFPGMQK